MATLLMPSSDHRQPQHSVLPHPNPHPQHPNRRVKKGKNAQKKPPQRGLGVAQLEKLRMQEECKKDLFFVAAAAAAAATPSAAPAPLLHFPAAGPFLDMECGNAAAAMKQRQIQHSPSRGALEQHRPQLLFVPPPSSTSSLNSGSCKSGVSDASPPHHQRSPAALGIVSPSPSPSPRSSLAAAAAAAARESFSSLAPPPPLSRDSVAAAAASFLASDHKRPRTPDSNLRDRAPPPLFDPSPFRQHQRRSLVDSREWVYHGVPEINKELSSFQIPGNTSQAFSSASNRACDKKCPWPNASNNSSASNNNSPLDSSKLMEWDLGTTTHYSGLVHCLNAFSPSSSSWQESHHSMFALKDSCSSSLNNSDGSCAPAAKRSCRSSPSSSSQVDFLELKLSSSSSTALPLLIDDKFFGDSEKLVTAHQEASGETDDCSRLSCCSKLDLSLKVACYEESSSLDLRLAL